MARRRNRSQVMVRVFAETGAQIVRLVTAERAATMVAKRSATFLYANDGVTFRGVRLRASKVLAARVDVRPKLSGVPDAEESCRVLTLPEAEAAVGFYGRSKTKGLGDWAREQRAKSGLEEYDLAECGEAKLMAFAPRKLAAA